MVNTDATANVTVAGIDEALGKTDKLISLLEQAKQLIREISEMVLEPKVSSD